MRHKTGGRSKGTPNKVTPEVREAIAAFAEANVGKLQTWLDAVAAKDPGKAADLFVRVLEYHVPKLARTESTLNGKPERLRLLCIESCLESLAKSITDQRNKHM